MDWTISLSVKLSTSTTIHFVKLFEPGSFKNYLHTYSIPSADSSMSLILIHLLPLPMFL